MERQHKPILESTRNTRELGGFVTKEGKRTKNNRFLRSDPLANLTAQDIAILKKKELRLILDLRTELEQQKAPDTTIEGVVWKSYPLLDQINSNDKLSQTFPTSLASLYTQLLDHSQKVFYSILEQCIQQQGCIVFHCTAGKDRTGVLAMLLLDLVGVSKEDILADYAATDTYLKPFIEQQLQFFQSIQVQVPCHILEADPKNMEETINHLYQVYNGANGYLIELGFRQEEIEELKHSILE